MPFLVYKTQNFDWKSTVIPKATQVQIGYGYGSDVPIIAENSPLHRVAEAQAKATYEAILNMIMEESR